MNEWTLRIAVSVSQSYHTLAAEELYIRANSMASLRRVDIANAVCSMKHTALNAALIEDAQLDEESNTEGES